MNSIPPITLVILLFGFIFVLNGGGKNLAYLASVSLIFHNAYISFFGTLLRPSQIIYLLFMLLMFLYLILSKEHQVTFDKKYDKPLLFCIYTIPASIFANIAAGGEYVIPAHSKGFGSSVQAQINDLVPIAINSGILTQNIYVVFPIVVYYFLRKLDFKILENCINYYVYSVAFLTIWNIISVIEISAINGYNMIHITNYLVGREGGTGSTMGLGFTRIGGFVGEPSHYAYMALPAFGYVIGKSLNYNKNNKKWNSLALLFIFGLIISFSTSGFVSFGLLLFVYSLYNFNKKIFFYLTMFFMLIVIALYLVFGEYIDAFWQYNMAKINLGEGSFAIRMWSIKHNLMLLLKYPLFGIGIGSGGALGGLVTFLSNIGIIGVIIFYFCFREISPIFSKSILFAIYALIIFNIITGDLSTFFSPIFALLFAYASKENFINSQGKKLRLI